MSLNINTLISRIKNRMPDPVFKAVDKDFWIEILMDETLTTYSSYYPKVVKGISVNGAMGVEVLDSTGRVNKSTKYVIPQYDELYPYTGIATFNYPRNFTGGGTFSNPGLIDAMSSRVMSSMGIADVRFTASFEAPNILVLNPPAKTHMDFSVSMHQMRKLEEVKTGYHELFKKLYECDCKIALYYKFYTVTDGGSFGGVELKDFVSEFKDYESVRDDLITQMDEDYYKDPDRIEEVMNYNASYV